MDDNSALDVSLNKLKRAPNDVELFALVAKLLKKQAELEGIHQYHFDIIENIIMSRKCINSIR